MRAAYPRYAPPPWERRLQHRRHPTGRTRRRWPRVYDGGGPEGAPANDRYARDYERDRGTDRRRYRRTRSVLDNLRQSPVRNGLIGLAVAGTAAPLAVNQYQQALRTDPGHEALLTHGVDDAAADDAAVADRWAAMETERAQTQDVREATIESMMAKYAEYDLSRELAEDIYDLAVSSEIDPEVAYGLVRAESSFKNTSTSRVGAIGLTQLMPATAKWLEPGISLGELRSPETNLRIGFKYLKQLIDKYEGNEDLALVAYNRGPGTVDRILKRGGNPDNGYAQFVRSGAVGSHRG